MGGIDFIQDLGLIMLVAAAVGFPCHRFGLPPVLGYIVAGVLIGPHLFSNGLVSDAGRIQAIAQVGLIFLIFNIGQGVTLQRLKQIGLPLIFATLLIAVLILTGCRMLGSMLGWSPSFSLVLAGMLMVSSTAVLGRCLREAGATHTRFGQTAITITALDDLIAIITLTTLSAFVEAGQADAKMVFGTVLRLQAVIATMIIGALLLVPAILNRLSRVPSEMRSLAIVGVLLGMALLSAKAGFSAELGAFLLGTIVASTNRGEKPDGTLQTLCDVFGPVFFVAMGMLLDLGAATASWKMSLLVLGIAIICRALAASTALLMIGHSLKDAVQAGICLTPIGEFSLIIALTGVEGGLAPASLYAVAVAVCVMTAVTTPILIKNSEAIGTAIHARQPHRLARCIAVYQDWIRLLRKRQESSLIWKLAAPRVFQGTMLVLFVSGMLIVAQPLHDLAQKWLGTDWPTKEGFGAVFWFSYGLLLLAPGIAVWRNIEAISMICAEAATQAKRQPMFRAVYEKLLRVICSVAVVIWWSAFFPYSALSNTAWAIIFSAFSIVAVVFWRRLIRVQSRFELEVKNQLAHDPEPPREHLPLVPGDTEQGNSWELKVRGCRLPTSSQAAGKTLGELPLRRMFACTVVSVDRQGVLIPNPNAGTVLYPNDKLFLLGRNKELREAEKWLQQKAESLSTNGGPEITLEKLSVPDCFRHSGKSLADLSLNSLFDIQIVGIERDSERVLIPGQYESLRPGDQLLVLGTADQVHEMAFWLST